MLAVALKFLVAADLHIGRRPTRLTDEEAGRFSAAMMWERIVERRFRKRSPPFFWPATSWTITTASSRRPVLWSAGLKRLAAAAIPAVVVAGNHDWDVLPRIQQSVGGDALTLLGRDGAWEETVLRRGGTAVARIVGWSFPQERVVTNPLASRERPAADGLPTIGMLHCDLDQPTSVYLPVSRAELKRQLVSFWLLGHLHGPMLDEGQPGPPLLYPGSPQAFDPGETGPHGPWLLEVHSQRKVLAKPIALSPVRYDACEVDLTGAQTTDEFDQRLFQAVRAALCQAVDECAGLARLVLRIRLVGEVPGEGASPNGGADSTSWNCRWAMQRRASMP